MGEDRYTYHEKGPDGVIEENYRSCGEHCESDQLIKLRVR